MENGEVLRFDSGRLISVRLKELSDRELKMVTRILTDGIRENPDLTILVSEEIYSETIDLTESEDRKAQLEKFRDSVGDGIKDTIRKAIKVISKEADLSRDQMICLCNDILSDNFLLEAFCLTGLGYEEDLQRLLAELGVEGKYDALCNDPVYINRRRFFVELRDYVTAAVNLYGVLTVDELSGLIKDYGGFSMGNGYDRDQGCYSYSHYFNPNHYDYALLFTFIDKTIADAYITVDGYIMHSCFAWECMEDYKRIQGFGRYLHRPMTPTELLKYGATRKNPNFIRLYKTAAAYPAYRAAGDEFVRYKNESYQGEFVAGNLLWEKYRDKVSTVAEWGGTTPGKMIAQLEAQIAELFSDRYQEDRDDLADWGEAMEGALGLLDRNGICPEGEEEKKELVRYIADIADSIPMWCFHGNSYRTANGKRYADTVIE